MSVDILAERLCSPFEDQPGDVRDLPKSDRDNLIISASQVDGQWVILTRYVDDVWDLNNRTSNVPPSHNRLDFGTISPVFRAAMKAMIYRYLRRGRSGMGRAKGSRLQELFIYSRLFLRYLEAHKLDHLSAVSPLICTTYAAACRTQYRTRRSEHKPLSQTELSKRFRAVEALYELSQYTDDRMPQEPWPETSATAMAGLIGIGSDSKQGSKTPLIPDDVFCVIFERAYQQIERGQQLLDLRDALPTFAAQQEVLPAYSITRMKRHHLSSLGWEGGARGFNKALSDLRTACYIVLASTSGCRNHELANLQSGAHHRTQDEDGTVYHWMRSRSEKTDVGSHDWMIPEAGVRALRLMERWSAPYQAIIAGEIAQRRRANPLDPQIAEASKHRHAIFLGMTPYGGHCVRTLGNASWNLCLKAFTKECGLNWDLTSHQFRRKFANYVAHSRFGDLRYLKEHYAHWTLDMTLSYAMDDSWGQHLDLEMFDIIHEELEDIKLGVVENWLNDTPLAGGYGRALEHWRREPQNLLIFKDHASMLKSIAESTAIRSNGHAWCTADNDGCVGNTLERTRCGDCNHAVIGRRHAPIYQRLYNDLKGLLHCQDIGEGGRQRVERNLNRCRDVLIHLGMEPETLIA
jgi:hypothetical protein